MSYCESSTAVIFSLPGQLASCLGRVSLAISNVDDENASVNLLIKASSPGQTAHCAEHGYQL